MIKTDRNFAESLVLEMQKRPAIYVPSHPDHKDRYKIDMEWTSIAAQLNSTVEVVKRRWQNLRGSFSKSLAALTNQPSGSTSTSKPAFYLFEQMRFLQHHMAHAPMHGNYGNVEELFVVNTQEIGDEQPVEELQEPVTEEQVDPWLETSSSPTLSTSSLSSTTSGAPQRKRPRQEQNRQPWEEAAVEYLRNKIPKEDSDLHFFKGLLPMVRGLKPKNKLKFFAEATSLLFNPIQQQDAEDIV